MDAFVMEQKGRCALAAAFFLCLAIQKKKE
ncbi:hypothetical protein T260_17160 [Geobacillus thermopakistaniensis]|uniref:Uncharacterized protein n=1 Tax=Geobacillus thermopakistaniensis (strain MAS1) TaxID=1408282 RepID=A0A7U9J8D0_GEOTM|nr:hypothetical protein GA8_16035 [Geobacillus sp. A8]ESU70788.1 hypothetical protein T260_17160 [Geobacillus sp. MAS1]